MDSQTVISSLNDQQKEAVSTNSTYTLVLAGAGSGKTRVLVHRVAWLIAIDKVPLQNIFVVLAGINQASCKLLDNLDIF